MTAIDEVAPDCDNHVFLRGRLAAVPEYRELPSGDVLAIFRLTVPRPAGERVRVDSIDCVASAARVHRTLARAEVGQLVEAGGRLRRRFFRASGGLASRYEVEVQGLRLMRIGRADAEARGRTRVSA